MLEKANGWCLGGQIGNVFFFGFGFGLFAIVEMLNVVWIAKAS